MFSKPKLICNSDIELATEDDLVVINAYKEQSAIVMFVSSNITKRTASLMHEAITVSLKAQIEEIWFDVLRQAAYEFPLLRMPFMDFNCSHIDQIQDSIYLNVTEGALRDVLGLVYGRAAEFESIYAKLTDQAQRKRIADEEERLRKQYKFTRVERADYKSVNHPLRSIGYSPSALRASGLIPKGYELVPIEVLDVLVYAGQNVYATAVGGHTVAKEIEQAAQAAYNILSRRKSNGIKIK
jgi:hypothetical protein